MERIEIFKGNDVKSFLNHLKKYKDVLGLNDFFSLRKKSRKFILKKVRAKLYSLKMVETIEKAFSKEWITSKHYKRNGCYCIKLRARASNRVKPIGKVITAKVSFTTINNRIVVTVYSVKAKYDNESDEHDATQVEQDSMISYVNCASQKVEDDLFIKTFIKYFYEILHEKELTKATGSEAAWMYEIYLNAKEHFPDFRECEEANQYSILKEGYIGGRRHGTDIYKLSKSTFLVMKSKELTNKVVRFDPVIGRDVYYYIPEKVKNEEEKEDKSEKEEESNEPEKGKKKEDNNKPDGNTENVEISQVTYKQNSLICTQYVYEIKNGMQFRASFHYSDLWNLLHYERNDRLVGF